MLKIRGFMDYRGMLLLGSVLSAGLLAASSGCSGPDPGTITFAERPGAGGEAAPAGGGGGVGGGDGGGGGTDAGGGVQTLNAFTNAGDFAYTDPGPPANGAGGANHTGGVVVGKDCVVAGCHLDNANSPWLIAGTIYTTKDGTAGQPKAQVRLVDPQGNEEASTFTDKDGNFWLQVQDGKKLVAGTKVGVRIDGKTQLMTGTVGPGQIGCNTATTGCHNGAQGRINIQ